MQAKYGDIKTETYSKTNIELKELSNSLGSAFIKDESNKNQGYPILTWQK